MTTPTPPAVAESCPECGNRTIEFKGLGLDTQYKICSRYETPGHLSSDEIRKRIRAALTTLNPSGRTA